MTSSRLVATILTVVLGGAVSTACNDSGFSGSNKKTSASKVDAAKTPAAGIAKAPTVKGSDKTPTGPTTNDQGTLGEPGTSTQTTDPDLSNKADQGGRPAVPNTDPNVDAGTNNGLGSGLADLLGGLLGGGLDQGGGALGVQPGDNDIIFGDEKTFHIGDGQMTQSSCLTSIAAYPVAGKQYLFEFDVLADGLVSVEIGYICGVDYADTNMVYIAQNGQPVGQPQRLPEGASSFQIPAMQLARGKYQIGVDSRLGTQKEDGNPDDADDYVLGKVHIKSQGAKIKIGKVYVN